MIKYEIERAKKFATVILNSRISFFRKLQAKLSTDDVNKEKWLKYESIIFELESLKKDYNEMSVKKFKALYETVEV